MAHCCLSCLSGGVGVEALVFHPGMWGRHVQWAASVCATPGSSPSPSGMCPRGPGGRSLLRLGSPSAVPAQSTVAPATVLIAGSPLPLPSFGVRPCGKYTSSELKMTLNSMAHAFSPSSGGRLI